MFWTDGDIWSYNYWFIMVQWLHTSLKHYVNGLTILTKTYLSYCKYMFHLHIKEIILGF